VLVRAAEQLRPDDFIRIQFARGRAHAKVQSLQPESSTLN
jgi:hypothetical protein